METESNRNNMVPGGYTLQPVGINANAAAFNRIDELKIFFQQLRLPNLDDLLAMLAAPAGKRVSLFLKTTSISMCLPRILLFSTSTMNRQQLCVLISRIIL